ncbi:hypothetical protein QL285_014280 [Trifolium repens]|nr:hypothetical protein QL285_014280 [Trifolium repens]
MSITRPEDFYISEEVSARLRKWENFPSTLVITGGGFNNFTVSSVKRKFDELIAASSKMSFVLDTTKGESVPLSFYLEELPGEYTNSQIPLLIQASMANFDVHRILVGEGSSCDIMYSSLFHIWFLTFKVSTGRQANHGDMSTYSSDSAKEKLQSRSGSNLWSSTVHPSTNASSEGPHLQTWSLSPPQSTSR